MAYLLPDGSEIYLHKGAKLKFPKDFSVENRVVDLVGEGYFNVKADPTSPFTVHTADASVRVTGTAFRIEAPQNQEEIAVLVRSGKVLFYNSEELTEESFRVDLRPGDIATYNLKLNQLFKKHDKNYKELQWN